MSEPDETSREQLVIPMKLEHARNFVAVRIEKPKLAQFIDR